jgi:hypothetical protein
VSGSSPAESGAAPDIDRGERAKTGAEAIKVLVQRVPVVAFVNNHFAGYVPETVRQLMALTYRLASSLGNGVQVEPCVRK